MALQVIELKCPGCGNMVSTGMTNCEWCGGPIVITSFNSVASMPGPKVSEYARAYNRELVAHPDNQALNSSIAVCYMKLGMYPQACAAFEKAIEDNFDNSETYFYAAVCRLNHKKAFLAKREDINRIEELIQAALMIEPRGIYYYFWAYIKYDFYERKYLNTSPNYRMCLANAAQMGVSAYDRKLLFDLLGVAKPAGF